jgi:hypothetical protein
MTEDTFNAWNEETDSTLVVRIILGQNKTSIPYVLQGGLKFKPPTIGLYELPTFIEEKLVLLKMLNDRQGIPGIGRRVNAGVYYVGMSPAVWESLLPLAIGLQPPTIDE